MIAAVRVALFGARPDRRMTSALTHGRRIMKEYGSLKITLPITQCRQLGNGRIQQRIILSTVSQPTIAVTAFYMALMPIHTLSKSATFTVVTFASRLIQRMPGCISLTPTSTWQVCMIMRLIAGLGGWVHHIQFRLSAAR